MPTPAEREAAVYMMSGTRQPLTLVRGLGTRVWDHAGHDYLDFVAGIASNSLGHCHPAVVQALREQSERLIHVSNYFYTLPQLDLAELLTRESGLDKIFFCNSGAEATEGMIKLCRKWGRDHRNGAVEIIVMDNGFHGRTLAAISASGTPRFYEPFGAVPGFVHVPFDDIPAVRAAITDRTCAVIVEPVQGEGGVNVPRPTYLADLRNLCDETGLLLGLDEVQTGMGRTGRLFAFQHAGILPDVMALAKGLGGGVPIGAFLARQSCAVLVPGDHGTTFGGEPLTTAVGHAVARTIVDQNLSAQAAARGARLMAKLRSLEDRTHAIKEVRGLGLLIAVEFTSDLGPAVVAACRERGLICNTVRPAVLRLVPPLTVSEEEIDAAVDIVEAALAAATEAKP